MRCFFCAFLILNFLDNFDSFWVWWGRVSLRYKKIPHIAYFSLNAFLSSNFHKVERIQFFKTGVRSIYSIDMEDSKIEATSNSKKYSHNVYSNAPQDVSLNIHNLSISDSGVYRCIVDFSNRQGDPLVFLSWNVLIFAKGDLTQAPDIV